MTSPILSNSLINWVGMRANSGFRQWLRAILANRQNDLLSKHRWHRDCFNSVNSEAINYVFNVLTLMPAAAPTMAAQRHTALFIFSSQGVAQWGEESLFLFLASPSPSVFSGWGGKKSATTFSWEFHSKCSLSLPPALSLWKRVAIMLGYPEEEEGKQGVCNPK